MANKPSSNKKVVLIGGGVGSSTFTGALKELPIDLATIVSTFDDGGSTGAIRRDYGGIALGDFRQCILASIHMDPALAKVLSYRFGRGNLFGVNIGNLLLKAFFQHYKNQKTAVAALHRQFGLVNKVIPVSYNFARLGARLSDKRILHDQHQIATYLNFSYSAIEDLFLDKPTQLNTDAAKALRQGDYLVFAPGHFFTSILPHGYVSGFSTSWKKGKGKKMWFANLLAHKGQDSFYTLSDYIRWFQKNLGSRPFDAIVVNKQVPKNLLHAVRDRFELLKITPKDKAFLDKLGIKLETADLVHGSIRKQQDNDTVFRAPLRHDPEKIKAYFQKLINA